MRDHNVLSTCNFSKLYLKNTGSSVIGMMDDEIPLSPSDSEMIYKKKLNRRATFKIRMIIHFYLLKQRMMHYLRIGHKIYLCTEAIKGNAQK